MLAGILLTLALQLLLASVIFETAACAVVAMPQLARSRRRRLAWVRAARALRWTILPATGLLVAAIVAHRLVVARSGLPTELRVWASPLPYLLTGAAASAGCWVLLHAGRRESLGRVDGARRQARFGGGAMLIAALAQIVVVSKDLLFDVAFRRALLDRGAGEVLSLAVGIVALGVAGFIALVAGMAGKPRPSGYFAAAVYLVGLAALAAAIAPP